ncbi:glycerol-3-phosphate dehydrogenase/oxidase [Ferrimonas gelatinilytica]|uniref:Glycerol-3-phosphate dehydrogenase/oxidase n=1 Tax=Ferrimonas gelatinilytica TaxID=1255257 RepID=A0ABP9RYL3_9GAMM
MGNASRQGSLKPPPSLTEVVTRTRASLHRQPRYDVIVIGGGITGAGIARESARRGWRTLLLERDDFAGGTSSVSSKMVHGGLRYLAQGQWRLTREAAQQREALVHRWPDLITPTPYYYLYQPNDWRQRIALPICLMLYHWLSGAPSHHRPSHHDAEALRGRFAPLALPDHSQAWQYYDALCDDSALVLRTLQEAAVHGAELSHYTPVTGLLRRQGNVCGVCVRIAEQEKPLEASMVINATGVWADALAPLPPGCRLRPLRGSHLMFHRRDLPLAAALTLHHPKDNRVVFCYPWRGHSVIGTTDLDHLADKSEPARMSSAERDYLMALLPQLGLKTDLPVLASWSGLRPILQPLNTKQTPSSASREHLVWEESGLVNITGGKLTTFVPMADETLALAESQGRLPAARPAEDQVLGPPRLEPGTAIGDSDIQDSTLSYWAEHGAIVQLADLLVRRTRLAWTLGPDLERFQGPIRTACQKQLGWSDSHWQAQWQGMLAQSCSAEYAASETGPMTLSR